MTFALAILLVKMLNNCHPYSVTLWRVLGVLLPSLPVLIYFESVKKANVFNKILPISSNLKINFFLMWSGIAGTTAIILQFYSLQYISVADSCVITFSAPVFISIASHFLLGEKSGFIPILCGIITLGGVVVITRPPILTGGESFDTDTLIGSGFAFICMIIGATSFLCFRYLRQLHFSLINMAFGLFGTLEALILCVALSKYDVPDGTEEWFLAVGQALLTFLGLILGTLAFKYENATTVSLCRTCDILFAFMWQFILLGVVPDLYSVIGGGIVILGVFVAGLRKILMDMEDDNPTRKRFWILLK